MYQYVKCLFEESAIASSMSNFIGWIWKILRRWPYTFLLDWWCFTKCLYLNPMFWKWENAVGLLVSVLVSISFHSLLARWKSELSHFFMGLFVRQSHFDQNFIQEIGRSGRDFLLIVFGHSWINNLISIFLLSTIDTLYTYWEHIIFEERHIWVSTKDWLFKAIGYTFFV